MLPKPTALGIGDWLLLRENLFFCVCPNCLRELNWRHSDASYQMTGECCAICYRTYPVKHDLQMYRIEGKKCDPTNVEWLFPPRGGLL